MNKQMNDTGSGEPLVFQTQNIPTSLLYLHCCYKHHQQGVRFSSCELLIHGNKYRCFDTKY